jgi:hypothetical protein
MQNLEPQQARELAEQIRQTFVDQALMAYEDAGMSGLCAEGRWEIVVDTLRSIKVEPIVERWLENEGQAGDA